MPYDKISLARIVVENERRKCEGEVNWAGKIGDETKEANERGVITAYAVIGE